MSTTDWATKVAESIDAIYGSTDRCALKHKRLEMVASIITTHAEPLVALLRESKREHSDGEDMICATDYAAPERGPCDCGADAWNAKVDASLEGKPSL